MIRESPRTKIPRLVWLDNYRRIKDDKVRIIEMLLEPVRTNERIRQGHWRGAGRLG